MKRRYLLTNDDGIYAKGLITLHHELSKDADCLVVAPEVEQSAVGHAITLFRPIMVRRARKNGSEIGYAVKGTPADCVKLGIRELSDRPIDLVVSGINVGANVGVNVIYSGTVSAATEGIIMGVPAMAISLDVRKDGDFETAGRFARKLAYLLVEKNLFSGMAVNVNVPALPEKEIKGVVIAKQGKARFVENFEKRVDPRENTYYWLAGDTRISEYEDEDSDASALSRGMITITPIFHDLTCHKVISEMRESRAAQELFSDLLK
ncbi:MAG: 5'/3'-nucleotidase SurE [Syntrophales bacterium]|nr:5'/3'-nucleotidase SurE [Syntrophales bacterium]NLN60958.1 5'/3'-nucleotidase SurE [Deltaproteobacteria bacterium]